jgi:transposase
MHDIKRFLGCHAGDDQPPDGRKRDSSCRKSTARETVRTPSRTRPLPEARLPAGRAALPLPTQASAESTKPLTPNARVASPGSSVSSASAGCYKPGARRGGHPANLGGHETWEDAGSWRHGRRTPMSCGNAVKMVLEIRERDGEEGPGRASAGCLGHPEALRSWVKQAEIDGGSRSGTDTPARSHTSRQNSPDPPHDRNRLKCLPSTPTGLTGSPRCASGLNLMRSATSPPDYESGSSPYEPATATPQDDQAPRRPSSRPPRIPAPRSTVRPQDRRIVRQRTTPPGQGQTKEKDLWTGG